MWCCSTTVCVPLYLTFICVCLFSLIFSRPPCSLFPFSFSFVHQSTLRDGAVWHVLPEKFWRSWCAYTGFDADYGNIKNTPTGPRPPGIDTNTLLDPNENAEIGIISKLLVEGNDYVLVDGRSAELLESWYPVTGPILARSVVTYGLRKKTRIDLFPQFLQLIECNQEGQPTDSVTLKSFPLKATFSDVQEMCHNEVEEKAKRNNNEEEVSGKKTVGMLSHWIL